MTPYIEKNKHRQKIDCSSLTGETVAIDFETYWDKDYSIVKSTNRGYVTDDRFDAYVMSAVCNKGGKIVCHPMSFDWSCLKGKTVISFNAGFDRTVYELGLGAPEDFPMKEWVCASAACAYIGINGTLADVVRYLFGKRVSKDVRDNSKGVIFDGDNLPEDMKEYVLLDSIWCMHIWNKVSKYWDNSERLLWSLSVDWGNRGLPIDKEKLDKGLEILLQAQQKYKDDIPFEKMPSLIKWKAWCLEHDIEPPETTAKNSPKFQEWCDEWGHLVPWLAPVQKKRSVDRLIKLVETMQARLYWNEEKQWWYFPFNYRYFGSTTGRWTSSGGFNVLNLPRDAVEGFDLRNVITPPPGHKFVDYDFSAIEVRVLFQMAGATKLLKSFTSGIKDLYEAIARPLGMWTKEETLKSDPQTRHEYKGVILGAGFGLSANGYSVRYGVPLSRSEELIQMYRQGAPEICGRGGFWDNLTRHFNVPLRRGQECVAYRLPSGRELYYRGCKSEEFTDKDGKKFTQFTYGTGRQRRSLRLTTYANNTVQATARDILKNSILNFIREGGDPMNIMMPVHDEILLMASEETLSQQEALLKKVMSIPPKWMATLPLECGGGILDYFMKD